MNVKELIKKYENILKKSVPFTVVNIHGVLRDLKQLDEPQKPVVPQFVADWIEECEAKEKTLLNSLLYTPEGVNSWVGNSDNQETFARAWLDGYEVEKEKRYIIKLKGVPDGAKFLKYAKVTQEWYFGMKGFYSDGKIRHTRKQLEQAGFGWVFDCPGIEVEEVE